MTNDKLEQNTQSDTLSGGGSKWVNFSLFAGACLLALGILEVGLRLILPSLDSHEMYIEDPELGNRLRPGYSGIAQTVPVTINSHGLRGADISMEKPEGTFRILVLGDSWTFGVCTPEEETYPARMESILSERFPKREIEVINSGVSGYETYNEAVYFRREGYRFEPDVVLIGYYPVNDVHDKKSKYERHAKARKDHPILYRVARYPKTDLRTYQYFQSIRSSLKDEFLEWWRGEPAFDAGPEELDRHYDVEWTSLYRDNFNGWAVAKESLVEIGELSREVGARPVVAVFPDLRDLKYYRTVLKDRFYPKLAEAVSEAGVEMIDTSPWFRDYEGREEEIALGNRKGSTHLNGRGYRVLAEGLVERLVSAGFVGDLAVESGGDAPEPIPN